MDEKVQEIKTLKLGKPVVVRKVPMTSRGCDLLRAVRDNFIKEYKEKHGKDAEIPFPTTFHLLLEEYVRLKGIKL